MKTASQYLYNDARGQKPVENYTQYGLYSTTIKYKYYIYYGIYA